MRVRNLEVYNEELDKIEFVTILGWCCYCKNPVLIDDKYKTKRGRIYHSECLEQMRR